MKLVALALLATAVAASTAVAADARTTAEPAPVIASVVAFIAGHPTQVACDPTLGGHASQAPAGQTPQAWTAYGGSTIYAIPNVCDESSATVGSTRFAHAIGVFIHEAALARGIRTESCAEMIADIGVFDVLRTFYKVPFFSPMSVRVGAQVLAFTRARSPEFQPEACWASGTTA